MNALNGQRFGHKAIIRSSQRPQQCSIYYTRTIIRRLLFTLLSLLPAAAATVAALHSAGLLRLIYKFFIIPSFSSRCRTIQNDLRVRVALLQIHNRRFFTSTIQLQIFSFSISPSISVPIYYVIVERKKQQEKRRRKVVISSSDGSFSLRSVYRMCERCGDASVRELRK